MAITVLAAPATTLLSTVSRTKDELGLASTDTSADDLLYDILGRASSAIARECGRTFLGLATYQETLPGSGSPLLQLANVPVLSVSGVLEDEQTLCTLAVDSETGYTIQDAEAGALYRPSGWRQGTSALSWGAEAYSSRYVLPGYSGTLRYTVTYVAGYLLPAQADYLPYDPTAGTNPNVRADPPPLPGAIEQACLQTVKAWYFARTRDVSVSKVTTADQSVTYEAGLQDRALPTVALSLLRNYRRVA